jgi:predicted nuclease of predicted toxin-antitoxin system
VKLLFDQNLSPRLVDALADLYPGSTHVRKVGLDRASDIEVWAFAQRNDYTIVSKDSDFNERVLLQGAPPKVVWIRRANCSTHQVEGILRNQKTAIESLDKNANESLLELF